MHNRGQAQCLELIEPQAGAGGGGPAQTGNGELRGPISNSTGTSITNMPTTWRRHCAGGHFRLSIRSRGTTIQRLIRRTRTLQTGSGGERGRRTRWPIPGSTITLHNRRRIQADGWRSAHGKGKEEGPGVCRKAPRLARTSRSSPRPANKIGLLVVRMKGFSTF